MKKEKKYKLDYGYEGEWTNMKQHNIVIVGAGRRGTTILETLKDDDEVKIRGIVDIDEEISGIKLAKRLNITTGTDFVKFLKNKKNVDVVFNATGESWIQEKIQEIRPDVEIIGGLTLKLVWGLIAERERALILQRELYKNTIGILTGKSDGKGRWTRGHPEEVTEYAVLIGNKMGLPSTHLEILKCAGILHDVGKLVIPDEILLKTERLTEKEYEEIKKHPVYSEDTVKTTDFIYSVLGAIRHHHERYDGKGYPDGLKEKKIPLEARILAVADSFAAMIGDRPYSKGKSVSEAQRELERCAGTQFDVEVVKVFQEILAEEILQNVSVSESSKK